MFYAPCLIVQLGIRDKKTMAIEHLMLVDLSLLPAVRLNRVRKTPLAYSSTTPWFSGAIFHFNIMHRSIIAILDTMVFNVEMEDGLGWRQEALTTVKK